MYSSGKTNNFCIVKLPQGSFYHTYIQIPNHHLTFGLAELVLSFIELPMTR